jgi:hypothetical protein
VQCWYIVCVVALVLVNIYGVIYGILVMGSFGNIRSNCSYVETKFGFADHVLFSVSLKY